MKIYDNFIVRLHKENLSASWSVDDTSQAFRIFAVGDVQIPHPMPKTENEDIPGTNGFYDMTEAGGRVFYQNRTIVVPLVIRADRHWTNEIDVALARLDGRMCDFAFNAPFDEENEVYSPEWIYTGRLSIEKNRFAPVPVTLIFDSLPFAQKATETTKHVYPSPIMSRNSWEWMYFDAIYGTRKSETHSSGKLQVSVSEIGAVLRYKYSETLTAGDTYMLGIKSILGGDVEFYNGSSGTDRLIGIVDSNGELEIRITVDGSYYTWTTENNEIVSYPSFAIEFMLAKVTSTHKIDVPSNVTIRPTIVNRSSDPAYLIIDGAVFYVKGGLDKTCEVAGAIIPGNRAKISNMIASSYSAVVAPLAIMNPAVDLIFREQEMM